MTTTSTLTAVRATGSSTGTPALARKSTLIRSSHSTVTRFGGAALKVLDALMRSLASGHI